MKKTLAIITIAAMGATLAQAALFTEDFNEAAGTSITALPAEVLGTSWTTSAATADGHVRATPSSVGQDGSNVGEWLGDGNDDNTANFASTALNNNWQVTFKLWVDRTISNDPGAQLEVRPNADINLEFEFNDGGNITVVGSDLAFKAGSGTTHLGSDVWQDITIDYNNVGANSYELDLTMTDGTVTKTATLVASGLTVGDMTNSKYTFGNHGGTTEQVFIDDLSIAVIPEPATLGMVSVVGGALLFIRRRYCI